MLHLSSGQNPYLDMHGRLSAVGRSHLSTTPIIQESTFRCSYHAKMFVEIPFLNLCSLPEKIICITWSCYIMVYKGERFISCIGTNYKCPDTT